MRAGVMELLIVDWCDRNRNLRRNPLCQNVKGGKGKQIPRRFAARNDNETEGAWSVSIPNQAFKVTQAQGMVCTAFLGLTRRGHGGKHAVNAERITPVLPSDWGRETTILVR